ncbi:MAG: hypothetical protein JW729_10560, partial [Bacteroidales bacterium]|nr:hypothetical protein [Bacteroidales bacterium]
TDYDYRDGVRVDKLIFGNRQFASVGAPVSDYSILRNTWRDSHHNFITVDCLTQNSSLGYVNDTVGLTGKLVGKIFDSENNPVTALKVFPASPTYFRLHTPIEIYEDGVFSTPIFRKFQSETIRYLDVRMDDFAAWSDSIAIEPLELSNIKPDTVLTQDIHLRDDKYVLTNIEAHELAITNLRVLNYPNPFNTSTNFLIDLPDQLDRNEATIKIHNSRAQLVKDLKVGKNKTIRWNGIDNNGIPSPSGVYYYQLHLDGEMLDRGSLILLK